MKILRYLIIFQFLFFNLYGQKLIIDSSFGTQGTIKLSIPFVSGFGGIVTDQNKNIFLFGSTLLYYIDSLGSLRTNINRTNPDTFKLRNSDLLYRSLIMPGVEDVIFSVEKSTLGIDLCIQKININNITDSSFDSNSSQFVGRNFGFHVGFGRSGDNYLIALADLLAPNSLQNIKIISVAINGTIDSTIYTLPDKCIDIVCSSEFSNILEDSKGNFYFGIRFRNYDTTNIYLVKLNSKFELDNGFGNQGFLKIHSVSNTSTLQFRLQTIIIGRNDELYLFMGEEPDKVLIRKFLPDGSFDSSYGSSGSFELLHSNHHKLFPYYNEKNDEILFFAYDNSNQNSKLYSINSSGQLNPEYEVNGGLVLDGQIIDFKPFGVAQYLVLQSSDLPYDRTMFLSKLKINPLSSVNSIPRNIVLKAVPNPFKESTTILFPEEIEGQTKSIYLFGIDGQLIKNYHTNSNSIVINKSDFSAHTIIVNVVSESGDSGFIKLSKSE
ncbi:MAG: hypothetical protein M3Q56_12370 [Bacteroidota bacterium]|nr:hypothetical protein [Bacteroidota bacterium]